ncbi:hypothetical protein O6H91_05G124900 [Diphasiastrum complanatum]|uniref:Uncharacterized protein n=1 Tax=Diphasiastrum complanatum TaxID=34168 RepID=A0ACC2DT80_DIPCM|nr:hypothetical protein O6H91_05G124900 [Diphasiastrum complanatum]
MAMARLLKSLQHIRPSVHRSFGSSYSPVFPLRQASSLVVVEHEGGAVKGASLSAVAAAGALSEGADVTVLIAGHGPALSAVATQVASSYPAITKVLVADSSKLEYPLAEPWSNLLVHVQKTGGFSHIVAASTSFGKNVLPRVAALLDVSPVSDVIQIIDKCTFVRPIYAGNALSTVRYTGPGPCIFSIRPTSFPATSSIPTAGLHEALIATLDLSELDANVLGPSKWLGLSSQKTERPDLGNARVVISGGRGLKNAENFKMLEKLADKLDAAVGASRAAVDAGFVPNDMQIGQTGKIVAPELYIAVGVSGAIQHVAGMKDSKVIVAINKDADAPIFQIADYGLAGDLFEIIPELISKLP